MSFISVTPRFSINSTITLFICSRSAFFLFNSSFSANILTSYNIDKANRVFLGFGQASRVPDARELYFMGSGGNLNGTPDLDQTTNREIDLGYETKDEREFKLSDIPSQKLNKFKFEYDFGDGWTHTLELEKTFESDIELKHPVCIEGARNCPPEDCGGIPGYENLVEAMQDPKHPEREELLEWLGKEYDPEDFDIGEINEGF